MSFRRFSTQTLVAAALLLAGCRDKEVVSYRAPRDSAAPVERPKKAMADAAAQGQLPDGHPPIGGAPAGGAMGNMAAAGLPDGAVSKNNALAWTAPASWQERAPGSIRKGSYTVPGEGGAVGDLSITAFPGDTGGLHANVNRWRGQVGLAPISDAEVEKSIEHFEANGLHMEIVELVGTSGNPPMRLLGAIVPHEKETWFFKLTGPDALVASQREAFRTFLTTIKVR
ncbi:hypothetical protein [Oleiharenicola sp. Vm1]|uniref:hypothetical protein n=1 Tax=Oleiharenicola sp. Vm1 TaxID=3398393 RepID=UPI0039F5A2D6